MARAIPSVRWMLSRGLSSTQLPQSSSSTLVARMEAASLWLAGRCRRTSWVQVQRIG